MAIARRPSLRVVIAVAFAIATGMSAASRADEYPNRYVRVVVPFPPGGGGDALARPLANRLSEVWRQQVVIENKGGAGGNIGSQAVAQAAPDGYTLLFGSAYLGINPFIYPTSGYDPVTDLVPVALLTVIPNLMVVPNSSPARTVGDFIALAKSSNGKLSFASSGIGASPHLSGELFKLQSGIEMAHVPYRGAGPAMNDLIPGRVDAMFGNLPGILPQAQTGTVRGLAVTSAKRSPFAPDIPAIAETLPGYEVATWWALFAPARTPASIIAKLHADTVEALAHPSVKERFEAVGAPVMPSSPQELSALLASDMKKWGPIVKAAGIKGE